MESRPEVTKTKGPVRVPVSGDGLPGWEGVVLEPSAPDWPTASFLEVTEAAVPVVVLSESEAQSEALT